MKEIKKCVMMLLAFGAVFIFSTGAFADEVPMTAEEQAITEATAMVVDEANNTITYINPDETTDENVNVYEKFNDVPEDAWYENYLSHLVQLGVISGVGENEFAPNDYVTRAQFATMLAYASNADLTQYQGVTSFTDVSVSVWYAPQVEWAYQQGLIKGRGEGLFCPESNITREEAVAIIDRYAVSEDSPVLDDNQYELDDNADEYLSDEEIGVLDALLADPAYEDETEISSWATEDVNAMSTAGIICGDEDGNFNPQDPIKRSECVKVISAYIINDTKPTFYFPGGSYIEYLDTGDDAVTTSSTEDTAGSEEDVVDFNGYGDAPDLDELLGNSSGDITVSWAWGTHTNATNAALNKLAKDRSYITNKMSSESSNYYYDADDNGTNELHRLTGTQAIRVYSYYTDALENQGGEYYSHFYDSDTETSYGDAPANENAFWFFNNHFYNAYTSYLNGSKAASYQQMGMCIHYLEDMNNPYHASNKPTTSNDRAHHNYEQWVKNNVGYVSIYNEDLSEAGTGTYRYMYDQSFKNLSNNFSSSAQSYFSLCANYANNASAATAATKNLLARTSRAGAGILNRYFYYGHLNSL